MSKRSNRLLIVNVHDQLQKSVIAIARQLEYSVKTTATVDEMQDILADFDPTVVFLDPVGPDAEGFETLKILSNSKSSAEVSLISGSRARALNTTFDVGRILNLDMRKTLRVPVFDDDIHDILQKAKRD